MSNNTNHNGVTPPAPVQATPQNTIFDQAALKQYFQKYGISFFEDSNKLVQTTEAHVYVDDHYRHADLGNVMLMGDFNGDSLASFRAGEFAIGGNFITNAKSVKFETLRVNNVIIPKAELVKGETLIARKSVYANDAINVIVSDKIIVDNDFLSNKAEAISTNKLSIGGTLFASQLKILAEDREIGNDKNIPFHLR